MVDCWEGLAGIDVDYVVVVAILCILECIIINPTIRLHSVPNYFPTITLSLPLSLSPITTIKITPSSNPIPQTHQDILFFLIKQPRLFLQHL